jgi:hypothetical protein
MQIAKTLDRFAYLHPVKGSKFLYIQLCKPV